MKFRFCWDCDCPDWVLAEIVTVSSMTTLEVEKLCKIVTESICENPPIDDIKEIQEKKGTDGAACLAAIRWIMQSAASSDTFPSVLNSELQQLGLPEAHSQTLVQIYEENKNGLQEALRRQSLKGSKDVTWNFETKKIEVSGKIEPVFQVSISGQFRDLNKPQKSSEANRSETFCVRQNQLQALYHELTQIETAMEELKN